LPEEGKEKKRTRNAHPGKGKGKNIVEAVQLATEGEKKVLEKRRKGALQSALSRTREEEKKKKRADSHCFCGGEKKTKAKKTKKNTAMRNAIQKEKEGKESACGAAFASSRGGGRKKGKNVKRKMDFHLIDVICWAEGKRGEEKTTEFEAQIF